MERQAWAAALVREARHRVHLTQRELAKRAGTTQSVIGRIEAGRGNPSVETIDRLLAAAGFELQPTLRATGATGAPDAVIDAYKKDIDRTLLRENLKKTPEARLRALESLIRLANEAHRAGAKLRRRR